MKPLLFQETRRFPRAQDPLLPEIVAAIEATAIREEQIRNEHLFVFGSHDPADGSVRVNTALARLIVALHEFVHKARPTDRKSVV